MKTLPQILDGWGQVGVQAIKKDLEQVRATGKTVDSVRYEVKHEGTVDRLTYYAREWTKLLEEGRGPTTKNPSPEMIENLTEYAKARGFQNPKSAAWAIAKKMNKEGDKTKRQGGRIVYSDTVQDLIKGIRKDVTTNFTTKFMQTIKGSFAVLLLIVFASCASTKGYDYKTGELKGVRFKRGISQTQKAWLGFNVFFGVNFYTKDGSNSN